MNVQLDSLHRNTGISNNNDTKIILLVHWNLVGIVRLIGLKPVGEGILRPDGGVHPP
jgi:hypothetical protein